MKKNSANGSFIMQIYTTFEKIANFHEFPLKILIQGLHLCLLNGKIEEH